MDSKQNADHDMDSGDTSNNGPLRKNAAELMLQQRDSIMRRIHLLLGDDARKITDTEDILSTTMRRIDRIVQSGRLQAITEAQFYAFVHAVIRRSILEKARNSRRIKTHERASFQLSSNQEMDSENLRRPEVEFAERVGKFVTDPIDREIVLLRGRDHSFTEIALVMQMTPQAVRKRWSRIKATVREMLTEDLSQ